MIVIVVDMHRSGTSALAGMLHHSEILMGEFRNLIPKPSPENQKGFFGNIRFRTINDRILKDASYKVKPWSTAIPNKKRVSNQHS